LGGAGVGVGAAHDALGGAGVRVGAAHGALVGVQIVAVVGAAVKWHFGDPFWAPFLWVFPRDY